MVVTIQTSSRSPPEKSGAATEAPGSHLMDSSERWRISQVLSINAAVRLLKKEENGLYNCICSILTDADFIEQVASLSLSRYNPPPPPGAPVPSFRWLPRPQRSRTLVLNF